MENENFSFQLVLAHKHRRNAAERAIRNGKNHFLVGLSSVDDGFPMHFCGQLLNQSESTLNLLLPTILNTLLSRYNMIWGAFEFKRTPTGLTGCKIIVHRTPGKRELWAYHGVPGFFMRHFVHVYCTYMAYIPKTRAAQSADTVDFFTINHDALHVNNIHHHKCIR